MSEPMQNDDTNPESDVSMIDAMASVTDGWQAIFWLFFAVFMVGMLIYLLIDTAAEKSKASQRSKAVQEKVEKYRKEVLGIEMTHGEQP